jgi:pimeloyl-ACP methyl ester carboxylesterase
MSSPGRGRIISAPQLNYLEWRGRGTGSIVLVHGNSANAWWWRWTVDALDGAYDRVVALDLRGHGDSAWVSPPAYTPMIYGEDIARLIDALQLDRPIVAGHSMGGIATLAFACRFPTMARAAVAIDIAVTSSARRNRYLRHLQVLPTVVYPDLATARSRFRLMPREGAIDPAILAEVAEHSIARTPEGGYTMKFDRESFFGSDGLDVSAAIRQVTLPLLLIRAERSRIMTAEAAAAAVASNPRVRLVTVPDAHHHLPLESPRELADHLRSFMDSMEAAAD